MKKKFIIFMSVILLITTTLSFNQSYDSQINLLGEEIIESTSIYDANSSNESFIDINDLNTYSNKNEAYITNTKLLLEEELLSIKNVTKCNIEFGIKNDTIDSVTVYLTCINESNSKTTKQITEYISKTLNLLPSNITIIYN